MRSIVLTSRGTPAADAIRRIRVSAVTSDRWRPGFGGLKSDYVKRLEDLETEHARLWRAVSEVIADHRISRSSTSSHGASQARSPDPYT
jgi:hypothetical protein